MSAFGFNVRFVPNLRVGLGLKPLQAVRTNLGISMVDAWAPRAPSVKAPPVPRPKRHTIRVGHVDKQGNMRSGKTGRVRCRVGDGVGLFVGMRSKHVTLIGRARCTALKSVTIWPDSMAVMLNGALLGPRKLNDFARDDGFESARDMQAFWIKTHGCEKFEGVVIEWAPIGTEAR